MQIETFELAANAVGGPSPLTDLIQTHGAAPSFVSCHHDATLDPGAVSALLAPAEGAVHLATSCKGSVTEAAQTAPAALSAFCIWDEEGDYGTALASFDTGGAEAAASAATRAALSQADRAGEKPEMVLISATPGQEEDVLRGIEAVVGRDVPIFGGTAADNDVSGGWAVSDGTDRAAQGVLVSVLFPSTPVHYAYHSGYEPTAQEGTITRATGRKLIEIDGRPAAEVYQEWTGGAVLPAELGSEHNILAEATMAPLGRFENERDGVANYLLVHPAQLHSDGALGLFAEVTEGEVLTQMQGDRQRLSERAGRVAAQAVAVGGLGPDQIAGAYMIYCGGCLMAVEDRVGTILDGVKGALPGAPFQAAFTFGEQGRVLDGQNRHGNLMISCVVFTKDTA